MLCSQNGRSTDSRRPCSWREDSGSPILVSEIAAAEGIPKKFLEQILLELKRHGSSRAGEAKEAAISFGGRRSEISLGEIVRILDGPLAPIGCVSVTAYRPCRECQ